MVYALRRQFWQFGKSAKECLNKKSCVGKQPAAILRVRRSPSEDLRKDCREIQEEKGSSSIGSAETSPIFVE